MQAVIIASDPCFELKPLTYHVPKPLIRLGDKCIIEHTLSPLPEIVTELIIIVGHLGEQIKNFCGPLFKKRRVTYIKQKKHLGSARALHLAKDTLASRFLVVPSDGIYNRADIERCLEYDQCVLAREVKGKFMGERIILDGEGYLKDIIPGVHDKNATLANTGLYVMTKAIFNYELVPGKDNKKCEISPTLVRAAKDFPVFVEKSDFYLPVTDMAGIKRATRVLKNKELNRY